MNYVFAIYEPWSPNLMNPSSKEYIELETRYKSHLNVSIPDEVESFFIESIRVKRFIPKNNMTR